MAGAEDVELPGGLRLQIITSDAMPPGSALLLPPAPSCPQYGWHGKMSLMMASTNFTPVAWQCSQCEASREVDWHRFGAVTNLSTKKKDEMAEAPSHDRNAARTALVIAVLVMLAARSELEGAYAFGSADPKQWAALRSGWTDVEAAAASLAQVTEPPVAPSQPEAASPLVKALRQRATDLENIAARIRLTGDTAGLSEGLSQDPAVLEFVAREHRALANTAGRVYP
jgi:hypothetical protein